MGCPGKIARLPLGVREELNRRLDAGEPGPRLVAWLNGLPETKGQTGEPGGAPINAQNLTNWRQGGYARWQQHQREVELARTMAEESVGLEAAAGAVPLADRFAPHMAMALAKIVAAAQEQPATPAKERALLTAAQELSRLRRSNQASERLRREQEDRAAAQAKRREGELRALVAKEYEAVDPDFLRRLRKLKEHYTTCKLRADRLRLENQPVPELLAGFLADEREFEQICRNWKEDAWSRAWKLTLNRCKTDDILLRLRKGAQEINQWLDAGLADYAQMPEDERHQRQRQWEKEEVARKVARDADRGESSHFKVNQGKEGEPESEAAEGMAGGRGQRAEGRSRKPEARGQKSEARSQRAEAGSRKAGRRRPEAGSQTSEGGGRRAEAREMPGKPANSCMNPEPKPGRRKLPMDVKSGRVASTRAFSRLSPDGAAVAVLCSPMPPRAKKITRAWLESPVQGVVELARDWRARHPPPLTLGGGGSFTALRRVPDYVFGCESGYFVNRKEEIFFFLRLDRHPDLAGETVHLAGDFNRWQGAESGDWALRPASLDGDAVLLWSGSAARFFAQPPMRFKFVTASHRWLPVDPAAPNAVRDEAGNVNLAVEPERTGQHLFHFTVAQPLDLAEAHTIRWADGDDGQSAPLMPGAFFFAQGSDLPLGALVRGSETVFRLFAPRAKKVELCVCDELARQAAPHRYPLGRRADAHGAAGVWELVLAQNLHGWFYWYSVDGPRDAFGGFAPEHPVLDPYALATVDRQGPGIVLDREWIGAGDRSLVTPAWQDLVIAEAHVRDLTALAPVAVSPEARRGFSGLLAWVESPAFYLDRLGVNCVELQPVQEFDNVAPADYHWGYMTNNYFAPESSYALDPARASGVKELQALVAAFHRRGMAVVLDVVYNHVGEPAHLMFIDKLYYFEQDAEGRLANWSGCGNDVRAGAAMAKRLIIDSCTHLLEAYGVDGFRFDLADLLGTPVLREVETALKRVHPGVILIAEPWSFRGHIAGELRDTGWTSWNDGYRNFLRDYVRGGSTRGSFEYFLRGSPWYYAKWPAQTVNYTESHDDRTWIDVITENGDGNGDRPTLNDRRRTHLMAAVLFMSVGIPMLAAGQDFLRSKQGVNNTYLRGDLNALDYRRLWRFPATHAYFADWIAFRRSETGRLVRQFTRSSEGFFQFFWAPDATAAAVLFNADRSQGPVRLLFAVNPSLGDVSVPLGPDASSGGWRQLADHEHFFSTRRPLPGQPVEPELFVPALGCGLWISEAG